MDKKQMFFYSPNYNDACSFYRGIAPFSKLKNVDLKIPTTSISWSTVIGSDVAFLQRPCTEQHLNMANLIKKQNIPLWIDYDDDLLNVPLENPAYNHFNGLAKHIEGIVKAADIITVTTEQLKDLYGAINPDANIRVIPNGWNDYLLPNRNNNEEFQKVVFWRGSDSHVKDLWEISDELVMVSKDNPDTNFIFMGMVPWWLEGRMKYGHIKPVDIMDYFNMLNSSFHPAVTIVPLSDNIFNKGKSNISYIEGTFTGSLVVAPSYLSEFNQLPGVINYNNIKDFGYKLNRALSQHSKLYPNTEVAWEHIKNNLLLSDLNKLRQEIIDNL